MLPKGDTLPQANSKLKFFFTRFRYVYIKMNSFKVYYHSKHFFFISKSTLHNAEPHYFFAAKDSAAPIAPTLICKVNRNLRNEQKL
jgi:hypothetical protein